MSGRCESGDVLRDTSSPPAAPARPRVEPGRVLATATALIVTLGLAACVTAGDILHGTRDRIVFSHKQHLNLNFASTGPATVAPATSHEAQMKMCSDCHFATPKDTRGEEPGEPLEASCLACHAHKNDKKQGDCAKCHTNPSDPKTYSIPERPQIHYSHSRHNDRIERLEQRACDYCHAPSWDEEDDSGGVRLSQDPEGRWHQICFQCHLMRTEWDRMNCHKCHATMSDREGPKPMSRFHHGGEWLALHGSDLLSRPEGLGLCAKCHDRGYCQDCHEARDERLVRPELKWPDRPDRQFIHRGDWINRHAVEARVDSSYCIRCHGVASFCVRCHEKKGLVIGSRATAFKSDRFRYEPSGPSGKILQYHNGSYADFISNTGSPEFHGVSARRDIVLCASCHDYGARSVCIDCHADPKVKAPRINGGNPHPPGFHSAIPKSARPCSYCHGNTGR